MAWNIKAELFESPLVIGVDISDRKRFERDLASAVEKRQHAVIECCADGSRKARHDECDVESFADQFLIGGDELSNLRRICLELVDEDEDAVSLLGQFARKLREFELKTLGLLHVSCELEACREPKNTQAATREFGKTAFVDVRLACLLDFLNNALEHILGGHGRRGDNEAELACVIGKFPQKNCLAAASLTKHEHGSVAIARLLLKAGYECRNYRFAPD